MGKLNNKVILVTGASRGIGATLAKQLAVEGGTVILNYINNQQAAEEVLNEINWNDGDSIAIQADVSRPEEAQRLFDECLQHYGKVDVLINNAGVMFTNTIATMSDEEFDTLFRINVKGVFNMLREAANKLSEGGTVINLSTSANRLMLPGYGPYVATKAAVEQLTRVFAKEMGSRNINVNSVSPGPTNTELFTNGKSQETIDRLAAMSAFGRLGETDDIARVIVFLVSDDAKWMTAQNIGVNGGIA